VRAKPTSLTYGIPMFVLSFLIGGALLIGAVYLVRTPDKAAATGDGGATSGAPGGPANVTLVAKELKFDKGQIVVSAGAPVDITLDNQDSGVSHNVAIYPNARQTAATDKIAGIDVFPGPAKQDLKFTAPKPGRYIFRCDVHPDTMSGQFVVQ